MSKILQQYEQLKELYNKAPNSYMKVEYYKQLVAFKKKHKIKDGNNNTN